MCWRAAAWCSARRWTRGLRVSHIAVKNFHDLPPPGRQARAERRGRKPTSRRLYLDQGRQVLFSGTPCQVDGLYRYLGEHPERLITCDVACSGVWQPRRLGKAGASMAYVKQQRPLTVDFRGKLNGDSARRFHVTFENGGQYDAPLLRSELGAGITRRSVPAPGLPHLRLHQHGPHRRPDAVRHYRRHIPRRKRAGRVPAADQYRQGRPDVRHSAAAPPTVRPGRGRGRATVRCAPPAPVSVDRTKFFDALEQEPFRQVCARFLSALQPRERRRTVKELLGSPHALRKRKEK